MNESCVAPWPLRGTCDFGTCVAGVCLCDAGWAAVADWVPGRGPVGGAQLCALPVRAASAMFGATLPLVAGACALAAYNATRLLAASRGGAKLRRANVRLIRLTALAWALWCVVWALKTWDPARFVVMKHPVFTALWWVAWMLFGKAVETLITMYRSFVQIRVAMLSEGPATVRFAALVHGARAVRLRHITTALLLVENVPALLGLVAHSAYIEPLARLAMLLRGGSLLMLIGLRLIPLISFVVSDLSEATSGLRGMGAESDTLRRADQLLTSSSALLMLVRAGFALGFPAHLFCALSPAALRFFWLVEYCVVIVLALGSVPALLIFNHARACESRSHTVISTQHSSARVGCVQHSAAVAGRNVTAATPLSVAPLSGASLSAAPLSVAPL